MSSQGSTVTFRRSTSEARPRALALFARKLQAEAAKGRAFDCLITGDAEMRRLNRQFRGQDCATDVLSFPSQRQTRRSAPRGAGLPACLARSAPLGGAGLRACLGQPAPLGDIAISLARARAQSRRYGHGVEDEIRVLMLHGVLHLVGMDHDADGGRMERAEKRWRKQLGLPDGLIERVSP
jgi:probable rRNA maturation factor